MCIDLKLQYFAEILWELNIHDFLSLEQFEYAEYSCKYKFHLLYVIVQRGFDSLKDKKIKYKRVGINTERVYKCFP